MSSIGWKRLSMERESGQSRKKRRLGETGGGGGGEQTVSVGRNCGIIELAALDCTICYDPLWPPVLQCATGHVICSSCHHKLRNKERCHMCFITGGYKRCIAVEKILETVQVPCCNTRHGCAIKARYHDLADHEKSCPRAPGSCPDVECGFAGSASQIMRHLADEHVDWPSTESDYERTSKLHDLFIDLFK